MTPPNPPPRDQFPLADYLKTWHWECPVHGNVEMLLTLPPRCCECNRQCVQVANTGA